MIKDLILKNEQAKSEKREPREYEVSKNVYFTPDFEQRKVKLQVPEEEIVDLRDTLFFNRQIGTNAKAKYLDVRDNVVLAVAPQSMGGTLTEYSKRFVGESDFNIRTDTRHVDRFEEYTRYFLIFLDKCRVMPLEDAYDINVAHSASDVATSLVRVLLEASKLDAKKLYQSILIDLEDEEFDNDINRDIKDVKFIYNEKGYWQAKYKENSLPLGMLLAYLSGFDFMVTKNPS